MKTKKDGVPSFDVSREDMDTIRDIAVRAGLLAQKFCADYPTLTAVMDLTACHANGTPLQLVALLHANDGDFMHDVFGIRRHIDRHTGKLGDCFSPRYAVREVKP